MRSNPRIAWVVFCSIACGLPAAAQLNSSALRAKFGSPLHREVFHMPEGFDMTVNYGPVDQVCSLQVPALMPSTAKIQHGDEMRRRMKDFLSELVPDSMRGNKLRESAAMMGVASVQSAEYEHVQLTEFSNANPKEGTITVTFFGNGCPTGQ